MKKITNIILGLLICIGAANANVVSQKTAETVASNYYKQNFKSPIKSITFAYSENDANGIVAYYVFNVNPEAGFVIVSAEDAGSPIIGCSNTGHYVVPTANNNMDFWMKKRKAEIGTIRSLHLTATDKITTEWNAYINNTTLPTSSTLSNPGAPSTQSNPFPSSTNYLVKSTWDQYNEYSSSICAYNCLCPGGSVTGCVATAMSQIMRYWQYPAHGTLSSSYCDCTSGGFSENYGTLSANYATTNYHYSNMPLTHPTAETGIDTLMYDAGVSVQMDYSPSGSGAYVITADDPNACAQISYVKYFGYSSTILHGTDAFSNATTWQDTLETELNHSRPIQYVGQDPSAGGHTWVCDGFNSSNDFHMNWGWSGADDGWFALNNLNPGGYNFSESIEALIGIMPPGNVAPSPNFVANPVNACPGTTVSFTDLSLFSPTSWSWTFPGGTPGTSTAKNPTVVYSTAGTYNVTLKATNSYGNNTLTKTAYINVSTPISLPLVEGFEETSFPPANWTLNSYPYEWQHKTNAGHNSSQSAEFDNTDTNSIGTLSYMLTPKYDFSTVTSAKLFFDYAYAPYDKYYSDTLAVYVSKDCGVTFTQMFLKGGLTLSTTGGYDSTNAFVPTNTQWKTDTISLNAYAGQSSILVKFENRPGYGQAMYIDNVNITGNSSVAPTASYTTTSSPVCAGSSITYTSTSTGSPTSFSWIFQSGTPATSTSMSQTVTYPTAGTYTVSLTATNSNGSNTTTSSIVVNPTPTVTVNSATICSGTSATLTGAGGSTYSWNTSSTSNPITVSPTTTTNYTVTGTGSDGCKATALATVTVNPTPTTPTITEAGGTLTATPPSTNYQWYLNGVAISGATSQTYTPTANGNYSVVETNSSGCSSLSATDTIINTGINETSFENSFNVYPNPNNGQFELNFTTSTVDNYTIEIHNAIGQLVYQEYLNNYTGKYSKQINLQNFGKGIYMLSLTNSHNLGIKKLIVF